MAISQYRWMLEWKGSRRTLRRQVPKRSAIGWVTNILLLRGPSRSSSQLHLLELMSLIIITIISAERRPLLDIGLPQSSPRRSVLCCPHPATSRDLHQSVGPPRGGPTNAASPGTRSPFENLSAPTAVSPPRNVPCPLPLEVCNSSGYTATLGL
jgi:hypothetical protein